jgi:hypothetical protein
MVIEAQEIISLSKALTLLKTKEPNVLKKWNVMFYKKDGFCKEFGHDTFVAADPEETKDRELTQEKILDSPKKDAVQKTRLINLYSLLEKTYKAIKIDTILFIKDEGGKIYEINHEINIPKSRQIK